MKKMFIILSVICIFAIGIGNVYAVSTIPPVTNPDNEISCTDYKKLTKEAWLIIRIAAPVLLLIYGAIDMGKAVMASDEKEIKKATDTFVKRIVICIAIFLLPTIVDLVAGMFMNGNVTSCL